MHSASAGPYAQPIPDDVFAPIEDAAAASVVNSGSSTGLKAVSVVYSRGDAVWYRQRDGTDVPAKVVAVDMAVYPPSYGVMIGDNIRETEASRLRTRGSVTTQQPSGLYQPSLPNKQTPELDLQGASSGASFGDFTDAADTFALPNGHQPTPPSGQTSAMSEPHVSGRQPFSQADHVSTNGGSQVQTSQQHTVAAADRSAPLSLSLFGEDSTTSFSEELPASLQAPSPLHAAISTNRTGFSNQREEGFAGSGSALRPATAAARASLLQSMDRSVPISLGLFGEQSYEDPVLELADQSVAHAQDATSHQEAAPNSPGHASWGADQVAFATPTSASGLPETVMTDLKPSWQQVDAASAPGYTSSSWLPDQATASVPEPFWQGAASSHPATSLVPDQMLPSDDPDSMWHTADQQAFSSSMTLPDQDQHMFAATWPQPGTDTSSIQPPSRQAVSGPISLELFGLEEREDEPLEIPLQTIISASGAEQQLESLATQSTHSFGDAQQLSLSSQVAPGPISLELFGGVEASDAALELPIQAAITVLPTAETTGQDAGGSQWAGVSEVVRQPSPGPVSLEIFGLEEKEDEPLQLPLQAAITVLPTPDLVVQEAASQGDSAGCWSAQTLLMQACASELTRGHHIWLQVIGNGAAEAFLQDPNGLAYLQALQASRQSMARVLGEDQVDTQQSLSILLTAQELAPGRHCLAIMAALWTNRVGLPVPPAV
ncbi:hypothetical protein WJX82_004199 [Trebouxia sp. C0006]